MESPRHTHGVEKRLEGADLSGRYLARLRSLSVEDPPPMGGPSDDQATGGESAAAASSSGGAQPDTRDAATLQRSVQTLRHKEKELVDRVAAMSREVMELQEQLYHLRSQNANKGSEKKKGDKKMTLKAKKKLTLNLKNIQVNEKLAYYTNSVTGAVAYSCDIEGWQCVMLSSRCETQEAAQAFLTEMEVMESLPYHPNIIRHLHHDSVGDQVRLFVSAAHSNLASFLANKRKLKQTGVGTYFPKSQIISMMLDIWRGLDFLHNHRILHRNLSTESIYLILGERQNVQRLLIGDFAFAKKVWKGTMARTGVATNTFAYTAPEILSTEMMGEYSFSVDVWSFGMVLYELLTLQAPYHDVTQWKVPSMILAGKRPEVPAECQTDEYRNLLDLFEVCTNFDAQNRPSLDAVKRALIMEEEGSIKDWLSLVPNFKRRTSVSTTMLAWESKKQSAGPTVFSSWNDLQNIETYIPVLINPLNVSKSMDIELGCSAIESMSQAMDRMPRAYIASAPNFHPYQTYFITPGVEHDIFFLDGGSREELAVIVLESKGTLDDKARACAFKGLVYTVDGDERITIVCNSSHTSTTDRMKALKEKLPSTLKKDGELMKGSMRGSPRGKSLSLKDLKEPQNPKDEPLIAALLEFEHKHVVHVRCKFGVMYCKKGQTTEDEMLGNATGSAEFEEFLDALGTRISLQGWQGYRGGLSTTGDLDGKYSIYREYNGIEIMFHVSTSMAHSTVDSQQTSKKRHIGNDLVVIIFRDSDCTEETAFDPSIMCSQYNHVYIVVQPLPKSDSQEPTRYVVAATYKKAAKGPHLPLIPCPSILEQGPLFTEFLLTKLVNADRGSMSASIFSNRIKEAREVMLRELIKKGQKAKGK